MTFCMFLNITKCLTVTSCVVLPQWSYLFKKQFRGWRENLKLWPNVYLLKVGTTVKMSVVKSVPVLLAVLIDNKCRDLVYSCWVTALIQLSISSAWPEGRHAGPRLISDGMSGHTFTDRENGEKKFSAMFLCFLLKKESRESTGFFAAVSSHERQVIFGFIHIA